MDEITAIDHPDGGALDKSQVDYDATQLADITGYEQQMVRRWSLQKVIGMGLGLVNLVSLQQAKPLIFRLR